MAAEPSESDASAGDPTADQPTGFTLAEVLQIIPTTKRSQVELLVRTGKIRPAFPSVGTGFDRRFDGKNLFEIAVLSELIRLGIVGTRLTTLFRHAITVILNPDNPADADYLVLLPHERTPVPVTVASGADLHDVLAIFPAAYVLNFRRIVRDLRTRLDDIANQRAR